jgi:HK97 family phage major capsid protein
LNRSQILREQRQQTFEQLDALVQIQAEGTQQRSLTTEENTRYQQLDSDFNRLTGEIAAAELHEQRAAQMAAAAPTTPLVRSGRESDRTTPEQRAVQNYSLLRHLRASANRERLTGAEEVVQQMAREEARSIGLEVQGASLPSFMMQTEQRASPLGITLGTTSTGMVATEVGDMLPVLQPRTVLAAAGATFMTGLTANVSLPKISAMETAWETENGDANDLVGTTGAVMLSPKRLSGYADISLQAMQQTSNSVESWVRTLISNGIARAVDRAGLTNGAAAQGAGSGITSTLTGAFLLVTGGLTPTKAQLLALRALVEAAGVDAINEAIICTPGLLAKLQATPDSGNIGFLANADRTIGGTRVHTTSLVPSNGNPGGNKHALIYGDFSQLVVGNWGGVDLLVDQYTQATKGNVRVVTNTFWDTKIGNAEAFAGILDAAV